MTYPKYDRYGVVIPEGGPSLKVTKEIDGSTFAVTVNDNGIQLHVLGEGVNRTVTSDWEYFSGDQSDALGPLIAEAFLRFKGGERS